MKFHQLRLGERFRFQGAVLRKVSPLKAAFEDDTEGRQRLIPRSAEVVSVAQDETSEAATLPDNLTGASVQSALDAFVAAIEAGTDVFDPPLTEHQRQQLQRALRQAQRDLTDRLTGGG